MRLAPGPGHSVAAHVDPDRWSREERGSLLFVLGPAAATMALAQLAPEAEPSWGRLSVLGGGLCVSLAGALLGSHPARSRAALLLATVLALAGMHRLLLQHPDLVVLVGAAVTGGWALATHRPLLAYVSATSPRPRPSRAAAWALTATAAACLIALLGGHVGDLALFATIGWTMASAGFAVTRWVRRPDVPGWSRAAVLACLALTLVAGGFIGQRPALALSAVAVALMAAASLVRRSEREVLASPRSGSVADWVVSHPARLLVATFASLVALATLLLVLPPSSATGRSVGLLDAAFTAVSSVCVTGLIVLDTPTDFSAFGQAALLAFIQVGGLGIMTFYTLAFSALGRRMSLRHEHAVAGALSVEARHHLASAVRRVVAVTGVSELAGAAALTLAFAAHGDTWGQAVWRGSFTAVSAFCNAGFALQSASLIPYQSDPFVLHVTAALIVVGGLSPMAVCAVPGWLRGRRVSLQSRLILSTSAALMVGGAVLYALMEWSASLGELPWHDRLHNAWFQSITLRTAGFNSVELSAARPATHAMMALFMFIGGSPGGTAGGVKTTTAVVLVLTVVATLRGHRNAVAFGRRLGQATVYKAAAVVTVGLLLGLFALMAIELTQPLPPEVALFEAVSALGTVGLSIGGTSKLDEVGKLIIMGCMFAGRVGPLTLFLFLTDRRQEGRAAIYPEAEVEVG